METVVFSSWGREVIDNRQVKDGQAMVRKDLASMRAFNGKKIFALIGWNGLLIWDPQSSVVELVDSYLSEALKLSCGECDACNLGLKAMHQMHHRITQGQSNQEELNRFARLAHWVQDAGKCNFGQRVTTPILDALLHYRGEYEGVIKGGRGKGSHQANFERIITSPCTEACPVRMDVPGYIQMMKNNRVQEALSIIQENCILPGTVGRVCGHPCEEVCIRAKVDLPVAIRAIKRYVADRAYEEGVSNLEAVQGKGREKVAIIGAGPAGLAAGYRLSRMGYRATVFEKNVEPGGMGISGIPDYRLPREVIRREVARVEKAGVLIKRGQGFGRDFSFSELWSQGYKAVFLAVGAGKSKMIPIPGKELAGVVGGIEFLRDVKSGRPIKMRDRVVVIGGGNVAVDCARTALRIGAKEVHLVCLESRQEMPANSLEISDALAENVILHASWGPGEIIGVSGRVAGVLFQKCIAIFDEQRRFNPRCDIAKTTRVEAEMVILAVGQEPDLFFLGKDDQVRTTNVNTVEIEPKSFSTQQQGVFSGGDCVTGPATFIEAIAHGNKAAVKIDQYLQTGKSVESDREKLAEWMNKIGTQDQREMGLFGKGVRQDPVTVSLDERKKALVEVESMMTGEAVLKETQRCLRCYRLMVLAT